MTEKPNFRQYWMDRDRGILTESDRKFLKGEKDLSEQGERDARYRIRNRVEEGVLDLAYLSIFLNEDDRVQVADKVFSETDEGKDAQRNSLSFIIQMMLDTNEDNNQKFIKELTEELENLLKFEFEGREEGVFPSVDLEGEYNERVIDKDELLEKYENDNESYREFRYLTKNQLIEVDKKYWQHRFKHSWEANASIHFPSPEKGEISHDPSEYENRKEYIQEGINIVNQIFGGE